MNIKLILLTLFYNILNVSGVAMLKSLTKNYQFDNLLSYIYFFFELKAFFGFFLIAIGFLLMIKILTLANLSLIIPLSSGLCFIVTVLIATLFLKEKLGINIIMGIIVIFIGIYLLIQK